MRRLGRAVIGLAVFAALPGPAAAVQQSQDAGQAPVAAWLDTLATRIEQAAAAASAGQDTRAEALRLYLDYFERVEAYYGPGTPDAFEPVSGLVAGTEARFHQLMRAEAPAEAAALARRIGADVARIEALLAERPAAARPPSGAGGAADAGPVAQRPAEASPRRFARTPEIRAIMEQVAHAEAALAGGDAAEALRAVERAYLEGFEPIESRLPAATVNRVERLIHLSIRPLLAASASPAALRDPLDSLRTALLEADAHLESGGTFWFGAINSLVIILREGLEAVLLIAALLAYLSAAGAGRAARKQIYAGAALGVAASALTWLLARTLIPIGGASRELIEGVTGLAAVAVLLYVSHWLFQKTYIHDWKDFLRDRAGRAVSTGSALAMASLAFAAVYREGFETVLFYQALLFETGPSALLAGFVPGALLIAAVGVAIIRLGLKLPLRRVFAVTNAVLLLLAFSFIGKSIYNLQEAGLFSPHPLSWAPDHEALRLLLGFYPVAETAVAQAILLLALLLTYLVFRRKMAGRAAASRPAPAPARAAGAAGSGPIGA
ncbi:MAG TPA: FTR1 family protein [Longimicrobiales bacterium]